MIVVPGSFRAAAKPAASSSDPLAGADDAVGPADTDATAPDVLEQPARPKARAAAATVGTSTTRVERVRRDERVTTGSRGVGERGGLLRGNIPPRVCVEHFDHTETRSHPLEDRVIFTQYYLDCLSQASYLVADETTGQAVVVDPRRDVAEYLDDARAKGLSIVGVINTHFHADFVSGHLELARETGAWIGYGEAALSCKAPVRSQRPHRPLPPLSLVA